MNKLNGQAQSIVNKTGLLLLPMLLVALPAAVQAQFTFTTNNGTITITGYTGPGGSVIIPDKTNGLPVSSIGDNAFAYNSSLTSVTIPDSVTNIGDYAFEDCGGLAKVMIGTGVTSIGESAFLGTDLTSVAIPNSVTNIATGAFAWCYWLTNVTIGTGVTSIGGGRSWPAP